MTHGYSRPTLVIGPPSAGKTTVASRCAKKMELSHCSIDQWVPNVRTQKSKNKPMTDAEVNLALELLLETQASSTGLVEFSHHNYLDLVLVQEMSIFDNAKIIFITASLQTCLDRNAAREKAVPETYVKRCWISLQTFVMHLESQSIGNIQWILLDTDIFDIESSTEFALDFLKYETSKNLSQLQIFSYPTKPYVGGYLKDSCEWSSEIVDWILSRYSIHTVLDVGCGSGMAYHKFNSLKLSYFGVDAAKINFVGNGLPNQRFVVVDFIDQAVVFGPKFDLIWCVEVIEHVPECAEDNVIKTITENCGKALFLSAAQPNQPGFAHVNCKPSIYWINKIESHGFTLVNEFCDLLHTLSDDGPFGRNDLKNNGLLFIRI